MAVEVVAINPSKKTKTKSTAKRKGKKAMAGKKRKKSTTKRRKRRNPSVRKASRAIARRSKERFFGMNIKGALKGAPARAAGMLACKWAAKKFPGVDGGGDQEDWTFKNYLAGGAGSIMAGFIAENLKRGTGQKVLEGGIDLLMYKIFMNEVVPQNTFLSEQFGEDEEIVLLGEDGEPIVLLGEGGEEWEGEGVEEGDLLLGEDGEIYMMGADGYTRPVSEQHRALATDYAARSLAARGMGGPLMQPGALGGELEPPGALGGELERPGVLGEMAVYPPMTQYANDPYMRAYDGRG
jgi:hypothetical protein